jgi:hypothetical protein
MKKALVSIFLLGLVTRTYSADLKILGGLSLSRTTGPITREGAVYLYPPHPEFGAGFIAGGGIEIPLNRNVALEADALFLQTGSRVGYRLSDYHSLTRINELSIPVLVKLLFWPGTSPYLLAGPEMAFVLTDGTKSVDYGVVGGIGFQKRFQGFGISLEARYHYGLRELMSDDLTPPEVPVLMKKMRVFAFVFGFSL